MRFPSIDEPPPAYRVKIEAPAWKQLMALPISLQERLMNAVEKLEDEPRSAGCTKLSGADNYYRIRVGDYRIVYEIHDEALIVLLVRVAHRREVYRSQN